MAGFPKPNEWVSFLTPPSFLTTISSFGMAGNRVPRSTSTASAWLCRRTWTAMIAHGWASHLPQSSSASRFTAAQAGFFILRWTWLNKKPAGLKLRRAAFRAFRSVADVDPIIAGPNNAGRARFWFRRLGLLQLLGLAGEPNRFSGSLFSFLVGVLGACCAGHQAQIYGAASILTCWQRSLTGHHLPQTASASRFTRSAGRVLDLEPMRRGWKSGLNTSMALTGFALLVMAITCLGARCS
jgi:hypothetical protein